MRFEKGEKNFFWQKVGLNPGQSRQKDYGMQLTIYATAAAISQPSFLVLTSPITRSWAEFIINSFCQQGRLFALNVNSSVFAVTLIALKQTS